MLRIKTFQQLAFLLIQQCGIKKYSNANIFHPKSTKTANQKYKSSNKIVFILTIIQ